MNEALTPSKLIAKWRAEETVTVYLVMDQHGLNHRVYFAHLEDAQAYAERCCTPTMPNQSPNSYIVVPIPVWASLAARDATDGEGVG